MSTTSLSTEDIWPRNLAHRFRLYGRFGSELDVIAAAPTIEGIGVALLTLHGDARSAGASLGEQYGRIGLMDTCPGGEPADNGDWIIKPWDKGEAMGARWALI